jgi:hypothetical protein
MATPNTVPTYLLDFFANGQPPSVVGHASQVFNTACVTARRTTDATATIQKLSVLLAIPPRQLSVICSHHTNGPNKFVAQYLQNSSFRMVAGPMVEVIDTAFRQFKSEPGASQKSWEGFPRFNIPHKHKGCVRLAAWCLVEPDEDVELDVSVAYVRALLYPLEIEEEDLVYWNGRQAVDVLLNGVTRTPSQSHSAVVDMVFEQYCDALCAIYNTAGLFNTLALVGCLDMVTEIHKSA